MVQNDGKYGTNDGKWAFIVVSMVQNDCKTNLVKTKSKNILSTIIILKTLLSSFRQWIINYPIVSFKI